MDLSEKVKKILENPEFFKNIGHLKQVETAEEAEFIYDLATKFKQYNCDLSREEVLEKEKIKIESERYKHFLTFSCKSEKPVGFYNIEFPCREDILAVKSDRTFLIPEFRGQKLGFMMKFHLMQQAAKLYCQQKINKVVAYHFRNSNSLEFQQDLDRIKHINSCFGFNYVAGNGLEVPKSVASLDKDVYDFLTMKLN